MFAKLTALECGLLKENEFMQNKMEAILKSEEGRVGYLIAWLLGVPTSLLFVIFLIRGH